MRFCRTIGRKAVYLQPITFAKSGKTLNGYSCARFFVLTYFSGANIRHKCRITNFYPKKV